MRRKVGFAQKYVELVYVYAVFTNRNLYASYLRSVENCSSNIVINVVWNWERKDLNSRTGASDFYAQINRSPLQKVQIYIYMYIYIGYWSPLEHILFQSGVIWSLQYLQDVFASNSTCNRVTNKPTVDKAPFGSKY